MQPIKSQEFYNALKALLLRCLPLIDPAIQNTSWPKSIEKYPNLEKDRIFPRVTHYPSITDVSQFFESPYSGKEPAIDLISMEEYTTAFEVANTTPEIRNYFVYTDENNEFITDTVHHFIRFFIKDLLAQYYYVHGNEFDEEKFIGVYLPSENFFYSKRLKFDISIPILFTQFETDHLELAPGVAIRKISDEVHRARHSIIGYSPAIVDSVFMSATHELVLKNYEYDRPQHMFIQAFSQAGLYPIDQIEKFLAVLKIETNITSGYAQFLIHPDNWTSKYKYGLVGIEGASTRSYPGYFDDFYWNNPSHPLATNEQLLQIASSFATVLQSKDNKLSLAIKRFYKSIMREEEEDIIIDLIIALEILLGDSSKTEMTQKLAYRMGALFRHYSELYSDPNLVFGNVKKIYDYRSSVIHGSEKALKNREIKLPENKSILIVTLANDYLREVLKIMIHNPQYLDPKQIDYLLLTGTPDHHQAK